jgi:hypothetical protein
MISPPTFTAAIAAEKVRQGAGSEQLGLSLPVAPTNVRCAAMAEVQARQSTVALKESVQNFPIMMGSPWKSASRNPAPPPTP